jgi:hypothetical protein
MFLLFILVALVAFWGTAIKLWITDGAKIPLVFIALWLIAYFGVPMLHWPRIAFLAIECLLAAILLIIERYKSMT